MARKAWFIVWAVVSIVIVTILIAPWVLPAAGAIRGLAPKCVLQVKCNRACPLCGMTTAFIAISQGNFAGAIHANRFSIHFFFLFAANTLTLTFLEYLVGKKLE